MIMSNAFEGQPTPTQLMVAARLKQNPHWRSRLENPAQKVDSEPDAIKIYLATRIIETANDSKLYAYAIDRIPKHSESRRAVTFNLPMNENFADSQQRAVTWSLGTLDRNLLIRLYANQYVEAPVGYLDLQTRYAPDFDNPAVHMLQSYIRSL